MELRDMIRDITKSKSSIAWVNDIRDDWDDIGDDIDRPDIDADGNLIPDF